MPNMLMKYLNLMPNFAPEGVGGGGGADDKGEADDKSKTPKNDGGEKDDKGGDKGDGEDDAEGDKDAEKAELRRQLKEVQDEKARLLRESLKRKEDLKAFKDVDPEKYRELVAREAEAENERVENERKAAEKAGDFDRVKQMMADQHKAEKDELLKQIEALKGEVKSSTSQIEELSIGSSFTGSKFIGENLILSAAKARVLYGSHFEIEDGKVVAYDKPAGASQRTKLVNSMGNPLNFEEAIAKIVDGDADKESIMKSKMKPGAGSRTNNQGKGEEKTKGSGLTGIARMRAGADKFLKG